MKSNNVDELVSIPYEVIHDKALATQDYLFKLIIIGDTGRCFNKFTINARCRQKLLAF